MTSKRPVIKRHFPSWQVVTEYGESDLRRVLDDPNMIAHERKVRACVANARTFRDTVKRHGSFKAFLDQHLPSGSFEDLMLLKELLETTFAYLGGVTVYHFMTDIGLNVLKPDRVICRLFHRLSLLDNEDQLLKSIMEGRRFAAGHRTTDPLHRHRAGGIRPSSLARAGHSQGRVPECTTLRCVQHSPALWASCFGQRDCGHT
ncbi:hypothetical protein B2J88_43585 [Rhodococcus sp. SRB_17]|uniref:DNA-3-methyladenine glycosylase I n=1 Tax=Acidovorax sp. SRB_24 TaxID=1962700 RepID=UPI00145EB9E6|nr:hypothetical protein [Acidovorax sp. SRB_24]NMM91119.1 hypothetical protein [Rhodococcus sp. SRB_17]